MATERETTYTPSSNETIKAEIVKGMTLCEPTEQEKKEDFSHHYILEYGSRRLKISLRKGDEMGPELKSYHEIPEDHGFISTFLSKKSGPDLENQTTLLYETARDIMQEISNERGKPILYEVETGSLKMVNWVSTRGKELFGWNVREEYLHDKKGALSGAVCRTIIEPSHA